MTERYDDILDAYGGDPFDLGQPMPKTRDECADEMMRLDAIIGAIDGQIKQAHLEWTRDGRSANPDWMRRAIGALSLHKARRNRVNTHMGTVTQAAKADRQARLERAFMDAAMKVLTDDQKKLVWDRVAIVAPDLFRQEVAA